MNTERLNAIAQAVQQDIQKTQSENLLQQLVQHLQNQVNQPNQPQHQQKVSETLANLFQNLDQAPSNNFSPTWIQTIEEIGADGLLGVNLRSKIDEIFSRNQITPSVALEEIKQLYDKVVKLREAISHIISGFNLLNIGADILEEGEAEIGVLVPRDYVKNQLEDFGRELTELNQIFNTFAEVATGSRPSFEIRTISSSDLTVFLDLVPPIAACLAVAVERTIALYKKLLEIRKLHADLQEQGVPKQKLKGVKDHANELMENGFEELIPELMDEFYKGKDDARKNELTNHLRFALKKIANRIDRGFNVEIRVQPITDTEEDESGEEVSEIAQYIEAIQSKTESLQFIKPDGDPILSLPESKSDEKKKK